MLQATVTEMQNGQVTVRLGDGQTLHLPVADFEGTPAVGSVVYLIPAVPGSEDAGRQSLAKHLLNQMIGKP